jgi:tetratricopeptide (TPR) repeat protein
MSTVQHFRDAQGLKMTAPNTEAAASFDRAVAAYLGARADTRRLVDNAVRTDPRGVMARCLDGYLHVQSGTRSGLERAGALAAQIASSTNGQSVDSREAAHLAALTAWSRGDLRVAVGEWRALLAHHPRDILAIRISQFLLSYLGETEAMLDTVVRVLPAWDDSVPGYGYVLGCHAYALEEAGDYARAEAAGRQAVDVNPEDIWAAHAVAHVCEMQGRLDQGVDWISGLSDRWRECNNFAFHLRWHEGLFRLELEEYTGVLDLYDREVRPRADQYLDITNAVSLLWRLEQANVDVGDRWKALEARASARLHDHALVFADLHYVMALAAADDATALERFVDSCRRFAEADGTEAQVMGDVGLAVARAIVAHRNGAFGDAVELLLPIRDRIRRIGGSHAQRDLFAQLLIDSAMRANRLRTAQDLLAERVANRPRGIWGWRHYADVLVRLDAPGAAEARRRVAQLRGH